jgi:hypothetical protein
MNGAIHLFSLYVKWQYSGYMTGLKMMSLTKDLIKIAADFCYG